MSLLDDIIEAATDNTISVGTLLRKCLVLEQQVKNEKFRVWLNNELEGYDRDREGEIPAYRIINTQSQGLFVGFAVQMNNQPIPIHIMDEEDRKIVQRAILHQPAASYEGKPEEALDAAYPWHTYLVTKYQTKFFTDKDLILNRAWQVIPASVIKGLLEQIRTRVLRFVLELKDNLPAEDAAPKQVPAAAVEQSVVNNIYGGNVVIAGSAENFALISQTNIEQGDVVALIEALRKLGITGEGLKQLESDIEADKKSGQITMGQRVKGWLADASKYLGKEALKTGVDAAKKFATKWILQYYGIDVS